MFDIGWTYAVGELWNFAKSSTTITHTVGSNNCGVILAETELFFYQYLPPVEPMS